MRPLLLLSPAKKQIATIPNTTYRATQPRLQEKTAALVKYLKSLNQEALATELGISHQLAQLNYQRYQAFDVNHYNQKNATPALSTFQGDVYRQFDMATLDSHAIRYAQQHLRLLSGLYGLLRPLDLIQPYRLEMGCTLHHDKFSRLYSFWQDNITTLLNRDSDSETLLINLASSEYSRAINQTILKSPMIEIGFRQRRQGKIKNIGLLAKRARGKMARFIIEQQPKTINTIKKFNCDGYQFMASLSDNQLWVFVTENL